MVVFPVQEQFHRLVVIIAEALIICQMCRVVCLLSNIYINYSQSSSTQDLKINWMETKTENKPLFGY